MSENEIAGRRVLIVEDEMLIAMIIEDALQDSGGEVLGPVATLERALEIAEEEEFDAAILDVTIRGGKVYPVAELLLARGIPFLFASGYGDWALPETLRDQPRLLKPFTVAALEEQIRLLYDKAKARREAANGWSADEVKSRVGVATLTPRLRDSHKSLGVSR
jgi:DNA-binding response OmpR family regulator